MHAEERRASQRPAGPSKRVVLVQQLCEQRLGRLEAWVDQVSLLHESSGEGR